MKSWSSQLYKKNAKNHAISDSTLRAALSYGNKISRNTNGAAPIFTLGHLSFVTKTHLNYLIDIVSRRSPSPSYRVFRIRKHASTNKFRFINVPSNDLKTVQQYINSEILQKAKHSEYCYSYIKGKSIYDAALIHCDSKWLIKIDLNNFFESINEWHVYNVFLDLGYPPLFSFELSRICTKSGKYSLRSNSRSLNKYSISRYNSDFIGFLPQGAPTSPAISNLVFNKIDDEIYEIANEYNLSYTRYADDLTFSTSMNFSRKQSSEFIRKITSLLKIKNFNVNKDKTKISPPGSRKSVLGLIVNNETPKLRREFKKTIKQHLYFCNKNNIGPVKHASYIGFVSVIGFRNHLYGLICYSIQIEADFGYEMLSEFNKIDWPII